MSCVYCDPKSKTTTERFPRDDAEEAAEPEAVEREERAPEALAGAELSGVELPGKELPDEALAGEALADEALARAKPGREGSAPPEVEAGLAKTAAETPLVGSAFCELMGIAAGERFSVAAPMQPAVASTAVAST